MPVCKGVSNSFTHWPPGIICIERRGTVVLRFFATLLAFIILLPFLGLSIYTTPSELWHALTNPDVLDALKNSFLGATYATLFAAIFAIPLGYALARDVLKPRKLWLTLLNIPAMVPHSVGGVVILLTFSPKYSPIGKFFADHGFYITGTMLGVVLAMWIVSVPYFINAAYDAFKSVPHGLEKAAMSMGASPLMAFWTITLPLGLRGLITGAIQTWARAVSEFGAVVMVSYYPKTAPVMVYELFNNFGLKKSIPVAVITMTMSAVIFITIRLWGGKDA
ncbi:ABC transporter permease subunit [bacterium 3DAC]|nr:ABC transporter permease subunit [bacterium 3DAC]